MWFKKNENHIFSNMYFHFLFILLFLFYVQCYKYLKVYHFKIVLFIIIRGCCIFYLITVSCNFNDISMMNQPVNNC